MARASSPVVVPCRSDEASTAKAAAPPPAVVAWLRSSVTRWIDGEAYRLAASQAYTLLVALGPLFLVLVAVGHMVLGDSASLQSSLLRVVDVTQSPTVRSALTDVVTQAATRPPSTLGLVVGLVGALFSASSVFIELDAAFNRLFGHDKSTVRFVDTLRDVVRERVYGVLLVLGTSAVLLAAVLTSTVVNALEEVLPAGALGLTTLLSAASSFALLSGALTLCYHHIPDPLVRWRSAAVGGVAAAVLVMLLRWPFGWLVVHATSFAAYGVIGAVLTVLLWFYLTSCVLLFGACLTASHQHEPPPLVLRPAATPPAPPSTVLTKP